MRGIFSRRTRRINGREILRIPLRLTRYREEAWTRDALLYATAEKSQVAIVAQSGFAERR